MERSGSDDPQGFARVGVGSRCVERLAIDPVELAGDDAEINPAGGMVRDDRRGVFLMRTFMDEVTFNDSGTEVTMVKRRSGG